MKPRIVIVEDDLIIAEQLSRMVIKFGYEQPDIYYGSNQVIDKLNAMNVDLFLLDIHLGDAMDGIQLSQVIKNKYPESGHIFITSYSDQSTIEAAKVSMPLAYIVKPFEERDIYAALELAIHKINNSKFSRTVNVPLIKRKWGIDLTPREIATLEYIVQGYSNAQIAELSFVSINTVKTHVRSLLSKFGVPDRLNLFKKALDI